MILAQTSPGVVRERPYLAALLGLAVLAVIGIIPVVGGIVIFVGFGAVVLLMWRTLRGPAANEGAGSQSTLASSAG
jgi:hypothetical protein